ncbi:MAG: threonine synthase [Isosphaeraceae bacterium]
MSSSTSTTSPTAAISDPAFQRCINPACGATYSVDETHFACPGCGETLDVDYDWDRLPLPRSLRDFQAKWADRLDPLNFSGVWRFRELLPFAPPGMIVTIGEGQTLLQTADKVGQFVGLNPGCLKLQYEGMNPSGSFKDNGMAAAFTHARMVKAQRVACASTGNTSAALAVYCSATDFGFRAIIFIGSGKIAYGKLAQALDHGALTIQIVGDFDDAMQRVRQVADRLGIYLMNSVNPFRLEGQKTIMYRVLEALAWEPPDWIVVPGGNLGNSSAFGKAFLELRHLGLIDRIPRLAVINAAGSRTLNHLVNDSRLHWNSGSPELHLADAYYHELDAAGIKASTIASAIEINRPVNLRKCLRALAACDGVVRQVTDQEIMDAKARVGSGGLGCEPASAASVAGARKLREEGLIAPSDRVVCILTGHQLKDPTATVAYHGTDQENFERSWAAEGAPRGLRESTGGRGQRPRRDHSNDRTLLRVCLGGSRRAERLGPAAREAIDGRESPDCRFSGSSPRPDVAPGHGARLR